jgi:hypothetical protein
MNGIVTLPVVGVSGQAQQMAQFVDYRHLFKLRRIQKPLTLRLLKEYRRALNCEARAMSLDHPGAAVP